MCGWHEEVPQQRGNQGTWIMVESVPREPGQGMGSESGETAPEAAFEAKVSGTPEAPLHNYSKSHRWRLEHLCLTESSGLGGAK